jgi:hypothetical protein
MGAGPSVMYAAEALEAVDQIAGRSTEPVSLVSPVAAG